jgi:hypothetical protein
MGFKIKTTKHFDLQAFENHAFVISIETVEVAFFETLETLQILGVEMDHRSLKRIKCKVKNTKISKNRINISKYHSQ